MAEPWTEFLLARIAEDEAAAHRGDVDWPSRRLAECEAKRQIVELPSKHGITQPGWMHDATIRSLAAAYSPHPDYQESWA